MVRKRKRNSVRAKIGSLLFVFVMLLSSGLCSAGAAGNYQDTLIKFEYDGSGSDVGTPARQKLDYTSSYIYNKASDYKFSRVLVHGCFGTSGSSYDCTYGVPKEVKVGEAKYLPNMVKEWGYTYARLVIMPGSHAKHHIYALWSPDSV